MAGPWRHRARQWLVASLLLCVGESAIADTFFVSPEGTDEAHGTGADPLQSIQRALEVARPGDEVRLLPGRYLQDFRSVRDGMAGRPIVIAGPPDAVVSGAGQSRVVEIRHDYIELRGFTLDGQHAD